MNKKYILLVSSLLSSLVVSEELLLERIIVTAGYPDVYRTSRTKSIIVIEGEDIQNKGYENIGQVLDEIPSINVGKTGWGEIDIRGQGQGSAGKNLQVMLDGAPITTLVNHPLSTNYNVVPVDHIEKIEIIPGGGSILYGSGSAGGVINITTNLKNIHKTQKSIAVSVGTNNKDLTAHLGHNFNDNFSAQLSYSKLNKELYFKDTYRNTDYISAGLNYKIGSHQNIGLRYSGLFEKGQFIRSIQNKNLDKLGKNYVPSDRITTVGLDKNNHKVTKLIPGYANADRMINSWNLTYTGNLGDTKINTDLFYSKGNFDNSNLALKMQHNTVGIKNKLDIEYGQGAFDRSSILFGLDLFKQHAELIYDDYKLISWKDKTYRIHPLSFKYSKQTLGIYALNNLKYKKFDFTQGIRFDRTLWGFDKKANKNTGKGESKRDNINLALGVGYSYSDTGRFYGRYERSFTAPDGLEITDDFSKQDIEITKAKDTKYNLYELGFRDEFDFMSVNLTTFYSSTDNEMTRNYVRDPVLGFGRKSINVLKTSRRGIELTLTQNFGNLTLEQSYAYLKGKRRYNGQAGQFGIDINDVDWTNAGLKKVPQHNFTFKARYEFNNKWSVSAKYKYSGKYSNFIDENDFRESCFINYWGNKICSPPKFEKKENAYVKSHSVVDLNLTYKNHHGFTVSTGINNLFNKKYFEYSGGGARYDTVMPAVGRSYYLNIKYNL